MATPDFSSMSDEDLLASLPQRAPATPASSPTTSSAAPPAPATAPPAPAAQTPDFSKMSDDDLLAAVSPRAGAQSSGGSTLRGIGLGVRSVVQGAIDLPAMFSDNLIAKPLNAGMDLVMGKGNGGRLQMAGDAAGALMSQAGMPVPETDKERVAADVVRGGSGVASTLGAGALLKGAQAVPQIARAVGAMLTEAPATQAISGAASGLASGVTRESGGGEGAQTAAALLGGMAPTVGSFATKATMRGAIRGGEAGRQQMADNIATFENSAGVTPTLGQATQSRGIQAMETGLSNIPGSSGLMARRGEVQAKALQDSVQELTDKLAPNANGWGAGEAIAKGADTFKNNVKTVQNNLYSKLDELIPAQTPMRVDRTREALASLNEGIEGAPNLSQFFKNAKIGSIEQAFLNDLDSFAKGNVSPGMKAMGVGGSPDVLPYQAVQKLRTMVGREISEGALTSDVPRSKWRALYGALSDDLGGAAEAVGPQAQQAWSRANQYTKASIQRLDQLESVVNRDAPEKIFKAATSGLSDGGTQIQRVMKSMPLENRREVTAAVLQRLGRARNSAQNEMGEAFSAETFLTNLASMSPPARMALFGNSGFPGLRARVEQMGRMASLRREGAQVFANPSGTSRQAGLVGWMSSFAGALATANVPLISALAATPVLARSAASRMVSPQFVRSMAQRTELNRATPAIALNSAAQADQTEAPIFKNRLAAGAEAQRLGKQVYPVPGGGWEVR